MAVSDNKKCQTLINLCADAAIQLRAIASQLETYRTLFNAAAPSTTGTALDGNTAAVSNWINSIRAAADSSVTDGLIAAKVDGHENNAL